MQWLCRLGGDIGPFAVAMEEENGQQDGQNARDGPHRVFEFSDAMDHFRAVFAAPVAEEHKNPPAEDGGDAVGDDELDEFESARAGGDHHCAADAHE